jgi:pimeloyl-ACP methyl ester carboxylesterase
MNYIDNLREKLDKRIFIVLIVLCLFVLTGGIGMLGHGICVAVGGPIWIRNQYIGLWLTSTILFYSSQGIYLILKPYDKNLNKIFYLQLVYLVSCDIFSFIMLVCYGLAKKADASIWSVVLISIFSLSIYVLVTKQKLVSNSEDEKIETNEKGKKCKKALKVINVVLQVLFFIIFILLTMGSIIIGGLTVIYPPRGKFTTIDLGDGSGRSVTIHYLCDGPKNSSKPIFIFQGDATHGLMDYYGLHLLLKQNNRRSCIFDLAGLGYSDYMYLNTYAYDPMPYYHNMLKSFNESPPFIFVGWGGGGPTVYKYAIQHPEMVSSLTFLDVYPPRVEWLTPKILKNWTEDQYNSYVKSDLAGRNSLFGIINGLGVPWGLMPIFVPKSSVYPESTATEVNWYFLTDKTWSTQQVFLQLLANQTDPYTTAVNSSIKINNIMTVKSDQQIYTKICQPQNYALNSSNCQYEIQANQLSIIWRQNLTKFDNIVNCSMDSCNLGYYVYEGSNYTVQQLLNLY